MSALRGPSRGTANRRGPGRAPSRDRSRQGRFDGLAIGPRLRDLRQRPAPGQRLRTLRMSDPWFAGIVVLWATAIAAASATQEWQLLATLVWVPGFALLFMQWPIIGTTMLFGLWTLAPLFRRLLDLATPSTGPDILSLTPFMATISVAILAYRRYRPPTAVNVVVGMVLLGFLTGSVTGFTAPFALLFGLFAYCSAVLGVYVGYANGRDRVFTLEQMLLPMVLIASVYGVYQGLSSRLPVWDQLWLLTTNFGSVGTKEGGNFRVFSVLNSPYTYASLVAVYLAVLFVSKRVTTLRLITVVLALMGIFLTQSRGAWVSVLGGLVLITFFTGGRALPRLIGLAVTLIGMYAALGSTPAGTVVVQRAASVGAGANDKSGSDRITAITTLGPPALIAPVGSGIGSVGAASDLNPNPKASLVDNGYLIMLVQVGPFGWLLIAFGIGGMVWLVVRGTDVQQRRDLLPLLAPVGVYVPLSFFSETLYGLPGFILFYALGEALGRRHTNTDLVRADSVEAFDRMDRPWMPTGPEATAGGGGAGGASPVPAALGQRP
ncbi:MAG: O-antigen ligase family protein, partial [Solirubrobacteraceae bacterium]|nr:O-antigen ligase family protein [Solirubrobacteraceae bacterium]